MSAVVVHQENRPVGVFASMASRFDMDPAAFERTLMATLVPQGTSREMVAAFLLVAKQYDLNPFTKEIFAFPARGGIQPVVSVDGWMKLVNSHPDFDGMEFADSLGATGELLAITCRMFRKGRGHPVEVTEYMSECRRNTETWKQWPARMLRHKATIQCARYAFGFAGIMEPDEAERMVTVEAVAVDNIPPARLVSDDRKERCDEAAEQYAASLEIIRARIDAWDTDQSPDHLYTVAETWGGIPQAAQDDLWLAPTKGGWFTTHERDVIKTKLPREA